MVGPLSYFVPLPLLVLGEDLVSELVHLELLLMLVPLLRRVVIVFESDVFN